MLLNALFPTRDIGTDPAKIRDWAQAAEDMGFHCIEVADHVSARRRAATGSQPTASTMVPRDLHDDGLHRRRHQEDQLCSGVLILPQRGPAWSPSRPPRSTS